MALLAFGLNHTTAPVEIRDRISFTQTGLGKALHGLNQQRGVEEAVIVSTCNRTEIYCTLDSIDNNAPYKWFYDYHNFKEQALDAYMYRYPGSDAVRHLLRVASGLDSMILGEPQVLGQLKKAYHTAVSVGSVGHFLARLFQHSFHVAKEVRSNTMIGNHPVSIAFVAVRMARQIFGDLSQCTTLLIGAGETIELVAWHLYKHNLRRLIVANRSMERAQYLANQYAGYAIPFTDIAKHLAEVDVVITATASRLPILERETVSAAIKMRKHRPIFIVDIAVPRDVAPAVADLQDVYLYTIDDLKSITQKGLRLRQQVVAQAEKTIENQVCYFIDWVQSLDVISTIRALRQQAEQIQQGVLVSAQKKLKKGIAPELVLQQSTRTLMRKLIHMPSIRLRSISAHQDDLIRAAQQLFALDVGDTLSNEKK